MRKLLTDKILLCTNTMYDNSWHVGLFKATLKHINGRKRPLDTPERKIERRECERERERERERESEREIERE